MERQQASQAEQQPGSVSPYKGQLELPFVIKAKAGVLEAEPSAWSTSSCVLLPSRLAAHPRRRPLRRAAVQAGRAAAARPLCRRAARAQRGHQRPQPAHRRHQRRGRPEAPAGKKRRAARCACTALPVSRVGLPFAAACRPRRGGCAAPAGKAPSTHKLPTAPGVLPLLQFPAASSGPADSGDVTVQGPHKRHRPSGSAAAAPPEASYASDEEEGEEAVSRLQLPAVPARSAAEVGAGVAGWLQCTEHPPGRTAAPTRPRPSSKAPYPTMPRMLGAQGRWSSAEHATRLQEDGSTLLPSASQPDSDDECSDWELEGPYVPAPYPHPLDVEE